MEKLPPIYPAKDEQFIYGNCVSVALAQAFGIPAPALRIIFKSLGMKIEDGCSFWECTKIITLLCKSFSFRVKYVPNVTKVTYKQLASVLNEGKVLSMFNIHLSYMEDGKIFDSYFHYNTDEESSIEMKESAIRMMQQAFLQKPIGWWIIKQ